MVDSWVPKFDLPTSSDRSDHADLLQDNVRYLNVVKFGHAPISVTEVILWHVGGAGGRGRGGTAANDNLYFRVFFRGHDRWIHVVIKAAGNCDRQALTSRYLAVYMDVYTAKTGYKVTA